MTVVSTYACNKTNLMHYLSSVYSVTIILHVSGFLVAHHQEVTMYICNNWYMLYVLVDCRQALMEWKVTCHFHPDNDKRNVRQNAIPLRGLTPRDKTLH
jgi:hypothetical protein